MVSDCDAGYETHPRNAQPRTDMFASLDAYAHAVIEFVREHQAWAPPIVFCLAFGESLAFLSLLLPAWAALVGIGGLIGMGGLDFWSIWLAGAFGAAFGDWLSYWLGDKFKHSIAHLWPLSRHPDLLPKGERFIQRYGVAAIFIGRFFGPLRASVPLVAGVLGMHWWAFQLANFTSALLWAAVLLAPGSVGLKWLNGG
jgi:membrane protein DedA with SNARE-associated domain